MSRWSDKLNFEINLGLRKEDWRDKNTSNVRWGIYPFGCTDSDKIDFRGFVFREPLYYNYILNIDFSYSKPISGNKDECGNSRGVTGFISSIFEDCNFIGSELPANLSEKFINCDFSEAIFQSSKINSDFYSCQFVGCKMKDILSNGKKFINCDFTNSKLRKCNFYNCYFENCIFDGVDFSFSNISGSTFVKSRPSEYKLKSCSVYDNLKFIQII